MLKELIGRHSTKYKIEYKELKRLQQIALDHLKVQDMSKLKDRFEGQKYLETFLIKSFSELALEKLLGEKIITWDQKEKHKGYKPLIESNGNTIELITSDFESYPLVPKSVYDLGLVIFVNIETRSTMISGFAKMQDIIDATDPSNLSPVYRKEYLGYLKNFDVLNPIESLLTT